MSPSAPHTAADWDERYSGEPVWSGRPNGALVAEVTPLPAGRALDVGCGEGADAVWLALRGWEVTALDIAPKAVERTLAVAGRAGVAVHGVAAPILDAQLPDAGFDLVNAQYPALLRTSEQAAELALLDAVAPGGTLLAVFHEIDREHALAHGFDPDEYVQYQQLRAVLVSRPTEWDLLVDERRERHLHSGAGAGHGHDLVLRARRQPS